MIISLYFHQCAPRVYRRKVAEFPGNNAFSGYPSLGGNYTKTDPDRHYQTLSVRNNTILCENIRFVEFQQKEQMQKGVDRPGYRTCDLTIDIRRARPLDKKRSPLDLFQKT